MRQAGIWDPLLQCCNASCTWTNLSSSNKIRRNYKGLKIAARMGGWGKFWTKDTKRPKHPYCHFWRARSKNRVSRAKAGYCACPLHTPPPKGWADHLRHPSSPTPGHTPTLTPCKEQARPPYPPREWAVREHVACSHSPLLQQGPQ